MASHPATIKDKRTVFDPQIWKPGTGQDPAAYLVYPGTINAPGKATPGNLRHARPYLVNGSKLYPFPTGVEGFERSGQATLGLHHYIGDNTVDGVTIHYEEARITLSGTFPEPRPRKTWSSALKCCVARRKSVGLCSTLREFSSASSMSSLKPGISHTTRQTGLTRLPTRLHS